MPQMSVASGLALRMLTICAVKSVASGANFSTWTTSIPAGLPISASISGTPSPKPDASRATATFFRPWAFMSSTMRSSTTRSFWAVLNTQVEPSTIFWLAASEIIGVLACSASGRMARLGPVREAPRRMSTFSVLSSLLAALAAPSSVDWLSSMRSVIFRPLTPPSAFTFSASISNVCRSGTPRLAPAPVMSRTAPILMSPVAVPLPVAAPPGSADSAQAAAPRATALIARAEVSERNARDMPVS